MKKITALLTACLLLGGCTSTPAADQNNGNTDNPVTVSYTHLFKSCVRKREPMTLRQFV